jgi:DNA repair protein RecO (recombination protein O)
MSTISDLATVLKRSDYSETSQIITLLTAEHGKHRLIGKGVKRGTRKRFAPGLDLLETGQVLFTWRPEREVQLGTMMEWKQTRHYPALREQLDCLYAGQYAAEVTDLLTEVDDPHPALHPALTALLERLGGRIATLQLLVEYQRALLTQVGLWPEFFRCVETGHPLPELDGQYFSASAGGMVSRDVEPGIVEKRRVPASALAGLREARWTAAGIAEAFDLLDYYIQHLAGRPLRLSGFVRQACAHSASS